MQCFVYILASRSRTLYVGVTRDIVRRIHEHKSRAHEGFTSRYRIDRLVWFSKTASLMSAIEHEKRIKGWRRAKKVALIEAGNPTWEDLSSGWYVDEGEDGKAGSSLWSE